MAQRPPRLRRLPRQRRRRRGRSRALPNTWRPLPLAWLLINENMIAHSISPLPLQRSRRQAVGLKLWRGGSSKAQWYFSTVHSHDAAMIIQLNQSSQSSQEVPSASGLTFLRLSKEQKSKKPLLLLSLDKGSSLWPETSP